MEYNRNERKKKSNTCKLMRAHEIRMWLVQIILPVLGGSIVVATNDKVQHFIKDVFQKKK